MMPLDTDARSHRGEHSAPGPRTGRWTDMLDELDRQHDLLGRTAHTLAALTARVSTADRSIALTVDARGKLIDLQIAQAAVRRHRGEQLAQIITALVDEADAAISVRRSELLAAATETAPSYRDI